MIDNAFTATRPRLAARRRSGTGPSTRISLLEDVRERNNEDAWREFVDAYTPLVYGYCRQRDLQESDARDVTQNVFLAVSRGLRTFQYDPQRGCFRSWLGTITCREIRRYLTWVNRSRARIGDTGPTIAAIDKDLESEWETNSSVHLIEQAMCEVQPTFAADVWRAFEMTWLEDEPASVVARRFQRPVPWVYKAKFRVLEKLRETVQTLADDVPLRPR